MTAARIPVVDYLAKGLHGHDLQQGRVAEDSTTATGRPIARTGCSTNLPENPAWPSASKIARCSETAELRVVR